MDRDNSANYALRRLNRNRPDLCASRSWPPGTERHTLTVDQTLASMNPVMLAKLRAFA